MHYEHYEESLKKLYSMMSEGVCFHEIIRDDQGIPVDYRILDVNKSYERITGIPKKSAVGQLATKLYGSDSPPYFDIFLKVSETGKPESFESYWPQLEKYLQISAFSPRQGHFAAIFKDTTDQNISKEYLSTTLNAVGEGVIETDRDGRVVKLNPVAEVLTGWKNTEAMGRDLDEVFNGSVTGQDHHEGLIKKQLRGKKTMAFSQESLLISKSGRKYIVEQRAVPIQRKDGSTVGSFIMFRDQTEKYHADEALRQSQARYLELFKTIPMGVAVYEARDNGRDFIIREFNPAAEKIENSPKEQLIGKRVSEAFPGIGDFGLLEVFQRVWRTGNPESFPVAAYEDKTREKTWRENHVYKLPSGEVVAVYQDASERVGTLQALKEREQKFRFLFENMVQGVFYLGADGALTDANRSALRIFGVEEEGFQFIKEKGLEGEIIHEDGTRFSPDEYPSMVALQTGKAVHNVTAGIYNPEKMDFVWTGINAIPQFRPGEDKPFQIFVTLHDITDIKKAEKELRKLEGRLNQAQKMEALGTLASGIAHDFNNILFPLMGYAEMLRDDIPEGDPLRSNVEEILSSACRARDLVRQILTFSRQSKTERQPVKIQTILKEMVRLLRASIPKTIQIHYKIDEDCPMVMADPSRIHQIIMNLATNAFHAMEENGGRFEISLTRISSGSGHVSVDGLMPGDYLCLKVSDTGAGIPEEIQEKVFGPYFSTKPEDKGTDPGLAVVHGIVKDSGGEIRLFSKPGQGAEVRIYLPAIALAESLPEYDHETAVPGGREKIFIVDDEEPIIEMETMMLERLGYQVTSTPCSSDALEIFKKDPARFDLIITDMTMPDLTGFQLSSEIKKIRPDMPVILCTGYSDQVDEEKCKACGIEGYVMKPFAQRQMAETIRRILDHDDSSISAGDSGSASAV